MGGRAPHRRREGQARGPAQDRGVQGQDLGDPVHEQHAAALVPQGPGGRPARGLHLGRDDRRRGRQGHGGRGPGAPVRGPHGLDQLADRGRRRPDRGPERQREGRRQRQARGRDREQARQVQGRAARHVHQRGGPGAPGLRVGPLRLPGELPVRVPERRGGGRGLPEEHGLGALPAHRQGQAEPPAARRHQHRRVVLLEEAGPRLRRRGVPREPGAPGDRRGAGRPAAHHGVGLRHAEGQEGVPVRRPAARVDRGRRAAAGDAGLQRHLARDPEDLPPAGRDRSRTTSWTSCATGWRRRPRGRSSDGGRAPPPRRPAAPPAPRRRASPTAPAPSASSRGCCARRRSIAMLLVTGYPIGYALLPVAPEVRPALPGRQGVRRPRELRRRAHVEHVVVGRVDHADHHGARRWRSSWCSAWPSRS